MKRTMINVFHKNNDYWRVSYATIMRKILTNVLYIQYKIINLQ